MKESGWDEPRRGVEAPHLRGPGGGPVGGPGVVLRERIALVDLGVGVAELDGDVPLELVLEPDGLHARDGLHHRRLAVGDVADGADVDRRLPADLREGGGGRRRREKEEGPKGSEKGREVGRRISERGAHNPGKGAGRAGQDRQRQRRQRRRRLRRDVPPRGSARSAWPDRPRPRPGGAARTAWPPWFVLGNGAGGGGNCEMTCGWVRLFSSTAPRKKVQNALRGGGGKGFLPARGRGPGTRRVGVPMQQV